MRTATTPRQRVTQRHKEQRFERSYPEKGRERLERQIEKLLARLKPARG